MATTYMYLNNGKKVPVYGNVTPQAYSGPYRTYVTEEDTPKTTTQTKKQTITATAAATAAPVVQGYDSGSAALADEMRRQREAEERRRQEKIASINKNRDSEKLLLGQNFDANKKAAQTTNNDNLRQLYIAYMQGLKGIPQQQALWGAGGEIESLKNRSRLTYENNRASENRNYANILDEIQKNYNNDLRTLEEKYLKLLLDV